MNENQAMFTMMTALMEFLADEGAGSGETGCELTLRFIKMAGDKITKMVKTML